MTLRQLLNQRHSKDTMIRFMDSREDLFPELVHIALEKTTPENWRAAWLIQTMLHTNDSRINAFVDAIIEGITDAQDGHQRELLKVLSKQELSETQESILFDLCITIWENLKKSPSVRLTAFKQIEKTIKSYPELASEITFLLEEHYLETLSPGIKNICRKMKSKLQQPDQV